MTKIESFEELFVWKESRDLVRLIYKMFEKTRDFSFRDQIQRASVSIMNNISEGFERGSNAEFIRFLYIAKASAGEVRSMIYIANDLGYVDSETTNSLLMKTRKLSGSISNFIKYLKTTKLKP
jgi:four helix bundle protein